MGQDFLKNQIKVATGAKQASLVLKNANVVNVFTHEVELADVAVEQGHIAGIGQYSGVREVDLSGKYLCPSFVDGHIHLESSMVTAGEFEKAVLPHGTTCVITDPHEIANVCGTDGIDFMLADTADLTLDVMFMLPSCVPATKLDEAGAELAASTLERYLAEPRVLGLAEMMNAFGVLNTDDSVLDKLEATRGLGKLIDGHAPFLSGKDLNAYIAAGVLSDHECSTYGEALEKLRRGQYIMVREGTAAQNLESLLPLFAEPTCNRAMLVTDDKHPGDLMRGGHIDHIIRKAVAGGADPFCAIQMGTLVPALYFGLRGCGAVAPGYKADLVVFNNLREFVVEQVYKDGRLVARDGQFLGTPHASVAASLPHHYPRVTNSFCMQEIQQADFAIPATGQSQRVIWLTPHELLTEERVIPLIHAVGYPLGVDAGQDIIKLAVFERHKGTGHIGLGFLGGYGLHSGAVASSVAHDSHNLIVAGTNDRDMALAANAVRQSRGGLAFAVDGRVAETLALPIAGLMSPASLAEVDETLERMKECLRQYGIPKDIDPFMTLSFVSLPVIPRLRLNSYGVVDVASHSIVPAIF